MKSKTVSAVLLILIIVIFFSYFTAVGSFDKNITEKLKLAETYAKDEEWDKVLLVTKNLKQSWIEKKTIIMINFAEAEFSLFENHLNYIIGGAEGKQLDTTLTNILAAQDLWKNSKKIVPEP